VDLVEQVMVVEEEQEDLEKVMFVVLQDPIQLVL
jgi:hypothetical protein